VQQRFDQTVGKTGAYTGYRRPRYDHGSSLSTLVPDRAIRGAFGWVAIKFVTRSDRRRTRIFLEVMYNVEVILFFLYINGYYICMVVLYFY
jgi:hypothetical protein